MSLYPCDNDGNRVIVRNVGPAGPGVPEGGTTGQIYVKASNADYDGEWANSPSGTGAVVGPASSLDGTFALFDGTTGKLIKDSTRTVSYFATKSYADSKEDSVPGKALSEEDFTTVLKAKLDLLSEHFRGTFATKVSLEETLLPLAGDYAVVEVLGDPQIIAFYDSINAVWDYKEQVAMTGQEIVDSVFEVVSAAAWDINESLIFTADDKLILDQAAVLIEALPDGATATAQGTISYFDLSGFAVAVPLVSTGLTNMVLVDTPTLLSGTSNEFDAGVADGTIRYTGALERDFFACASVSYKGTPGDILVFSLYKNTNNIASARVLGTVPITLDDIGSVTLTANVKLATNDVLTVRVGNTTTAAQGPLINALQDEHSSVRHAAVLALARFRAPSAVDSLSEALSDPNPQVRIAAAYSLMEIDGEGAGGSILRPYGIAGF